MIRLELTVPESECLFQWLERAVPADLESVELWCSLRQKVLAARQQALQTQTCPVCGQAFDQLKAGRTGRYCSPACKQKAYRQRRLDRFRRAYPPPRR